MGYRLSKIYTSTGDNGYTQLADKTKLKKSHPHIAAIGDIDELNSMIGIIIAHIDLEKIITQLRTIQQQLFNIGAELALPKTKITTNADVQKIEDWIDTYNETLLPLKEFILPGGHLPTANCHLARAICRRAERQLWGLHESTDINLQTLRYINRLSDMLFVLARILTQEKNDKEIPWQGFQQN